MGNIVKIACRGADVLSIHEMTYFQGDLKTLSRDKYEALRSEIINTGFGFPIKIWQDEGKNYICGGHQSYRTLIQMEQEGWEVPPIPVSYTLAKDFFEAKRRVLQDISQYGQVEREGLYSFMTQSNIEIEDLVKSFDIPQVSLNMDQFRDEYFTDPILVSEHERRRNNDEPIAETVKKFEKIDELRPHPRNFRKFPPNQIQHIIHQIKELGLVKPLILARDNTILSGHAIYYAAKQMGLNSLPIKKLEYDREETKALKILVNDTELDHLAEKDDRELSEILKFIKDNDPDGLSGTGYDEKMLANLIFVTRHESEIKDFDTAEEWVGLPEYDTEDLDTKNSVAITILFKTEKSREEFIVAKEIQFLKKQGRNWSTVFPFQERNDLMSIKFEDLPGEKTS